MNRIHRRRDGAGIRKREILASNRRLGRASTLQERLTYAAQYLMRLKDEHISDPQLAARHTALMKTLTSTPLSGGEKYLPRDLPDGVATELSREILSIYINLHGGI
jgi:hypothetical protein